MAGPYAAIGWREPRRVEVARARLRRAVLLSLVLVLSQAAVGMVVNLYTHIPAHHSGAHPSSYLGGSFDSVTWAIGHGPIALAVHAALGLALAVLTLAAFITSITLRRRGVVVVSALASVLVIAAGFNGASFLDYGHAANSLIMALLAFAAVGCYAIDLVLLT